MWWLYCLPGRLIAQLQFLFPGSNQGNITATKRRQESGCAHFLFSTIAWAVAAAFFYGYLNPDQEPRPREGPMQATPSSEQTGDADGSSGLEGEEARTDISAGTDDDDAVPAESVEQMVRPSTVNVAADAIASAVQRAALSGGPERWQLGDQQGYAVPSSAGADGCRMVQVSVDGVPEDQRPAAEQVCP